MPGSWGSDYRRPDGSGHPCGTEWEWDGVGQPKREWTSAASPAAI